MAEHAVATRPNNQEIESAEDFERRVQKENNAQFEELRQQAQATFAAMKGNRALRAPRTGRRCLGRRNSTTRVANSCCNDSVPSDYSSLN